MNSPVQQDKDGQYLAWSDRQKYDKQVLALNAMTDLARKFSNRPDFHNLVDTLVLTLSGQFAVSSAFARLVPPGTSASQPLIYAIGGFKDDSLLDQIEFSERNTRYFLENSRPHEVDELSLNGSTASLGFILSECGVRLIAPLLHDNRLIGIFGLGEKVTKKPFEAAESELLMTIINTVTPLIVNSYLFHEISEVNDWYLRILDNVKQGVFVFDDEYFLKKVNIPGYNILKTFRPHLKHIESLSHLPLKTLFPEAIYPGWARKLMRVGIGGESMLWEKMKAKQGETECIYNVRVGAIAREADKSRDVIISLDDVTAQEENDQRLFDLEKFAEKGMMASSISHELNNYLGLLMGGIELSQIAVSRGNFDKVSEMLEKLKSSVSKMERFTAGLMDYAQLDTKKKLTSINSVVTDVLSFAAIQKRFKDITITTDLDRNLPQYEMDADQMAQLLLNLLNNAADAIKEVRPDTGRIKVSTRCLNEKICLSVSDNGAGIKPEIKERLFKFHLTTKPGGHGYGLVTCNKIIHNHHGQVDIESRPGAGTTFNISFPINSSD